MEIKRSKISGLPVARAENLQDFQRLLDISTDDMVMIWLEGGHFFYLPVDVARKTAFYSAVETAYILFDGKKPRGVIMGHDFKKHGF